MFFATCVRSLNRCPTIIQIHSLPHSLSNHLLPLSKISLIQLVFCRCFSHTLLHLHKPIANPPPTTTFTLISIQNIINLIIIDFWRCKIRRARGRN
ncbi:hypothetical protein Hanom_Chr04g00317901 [Helianthus anomalus]